MAAFNRCRTCSIAPPDAGCGARRARLAEIAREAPPPPPPKCRSGHSVGREPRALVTINGANLVGVGSVLAPCGTPSPGSGRAHRTRSSQLGATRPRRTVPRRRQRIGRSSCGPCVAGRCRPARGGASRWFCGPCSATHWRRCSLRWPDAARRTGYSSRLRAEKFGPQQNWRSSARPNATPFLTPAS